MKFKCIYQDLQIYGQDEYFHILKNILQTLNSNLKLLSTNQTLSKIYDQKPLARNNKTYDLCLFSNLL